MTDTFWSGKHKDATSVLNALTPTEGEVTDPKRPMLEAWRLMSNGYYDMYNNGGYNWKIRGPGFRKACRLVGVRAPTKEELVYCGNLHKHHRERLEIVADAVFHAALIEHVGLEAGR